MKPNTFILANHLQLFRTTLQVAADVISHVCGDEPYINYNRLPDPDANPFDGNVRHCEEELQRHKNSQGFQASYQNACIA